MAGARKSVIAARIVSALVASDCTVAEEAFLGGNGDLPWRCLVGFKNRTSRRYNMYFWTVSHGGKTRTASEYRIQSKLRDQRSLQFGNGTTVLLGYYSRVRDNSGIAEGNKPPSDMEVFVAWDPVGHLRFGASSSCQVPFTTMLRAYVDGSDEFHRRCTDGFTESVFAFRPEVLPRYLESAAGGHSAVSLKGLREPS